MALQEIDDAEINNLREHAKVLNALGANPKTRRQLLGLLKELNPNVAIPEIDAAKPVMDEVAALKKELADARAERLKELEDEKAQKGKAEVETWQTDGRKYLREQGYEDAGVEKVEELMKKRGLTDYEAAEAVYAKNNPPEESAHPTDFGNRRWQNFDKPADNDETRKLMMADKGAGALAWQAQELNKAFAEMRKGKGRR